MARKKQQRAVEELLRRHGPQGPRVETLVSEVRSDDVPIVQEPKEPPPEEQLGGIVVIWEFCLPHSDIQEFHSFLHKNEKFLRGSLAKVAPGASYRGTYMLIAGGDACCRTISTGHCYRTIWTYESLDAMAKAWSPVLRDRKSNLFKAAAQLRAFWLRDPQRSEGRFAPAADFFGDKDAGDSLAKLTLEAAKLNSRSKSN